MTKGPLTPPIVLYLILGVTLYDDDSRGSPMIAAVLYFEKGCIRESAHKLREGSGAMAELFEAVEASGRLELRCFGGAWSLACHLR